MHNSYSVRNERDSLSLLALLDKPMEPTNLSTVLLIACWTYQFNIRKHGRDRLQENDSLSSFFDWARKEFARRVSSKIHLLRSAGD